MIHDDDDDGLPDGDALVGLVTEHHGALILLAILAEHRPHLITHLIIRKSLSDVRK